MSIADAEINKSKSINELNQVQASFSELEKDLIKVYGDDAIIDLRTGNVKQPEKKATKKDGKNK